MPYDITVFKGSSDGSIKTGTTHRPDVTKNEVFVKTTHSGVCFTDAHFRGVDMALGHEGIGVVTEVGPDVKALKIGDRVGWGWVTDSCGVCPYCAAGHFMYCAKKKDYGSGNTDQGSFGHGGVWKEPYLFKLPDGLASDTAAPLLCAGVTVWEALMRDTVKPTDVVGIVGIGGLGHLAIQFAAKMGCEVVCLSSTDAKKEEALGLGAHHFLATKGATSLSVEHKINRLLVTTSQQIDWDLYKDILAPMATIFPLTVEDDKAKLEVPYMRFLLQGWKFVGSTNPTRNGYEEMLAFAALHKVKPIIQKFPLTADGVESSLKTLGEGKMRYRGVLVADGE